MSNQKDILENKSRQFCRDIWQLCQTLMHEREELLSQMKNIVKTHQEMINSNVNFIKQISEYKNKYKQFMQDQLNQEEIDKDNLNQESNENNNDEDDFRLIIQEDDNSTIAPITEIPEITNAQPNISKNDNELNDSAISDISESTVEPQNTLNTRFKIPTNIQLKECKIKIKRLRSDEILKYRVSRN